MALSSVKSRVLSAFGKPILREHIATKHEVKNLYKCKDCNSEFKHSGDLGIHKRRVRASIPNSLDESIQLELWMTYGRNAHACLFTIWTCRYTKLNGVNLVEVT